MKLYQPPGETVFAHRECWEGLIYRKQIQSKQWRPLGKFLDLEEKITGINTQYLKTHYRGSPTPRFLKCVSLIEKSKQVASESNLSLPIK